MRHVLGVVLVVSVAMERAYAQPSNASALAEQLFSQARELTKANRWAEACPKFEASLRYDPVLGTRLNLAACYEHIGKLASAWGLYRESKELADRAGDVKRRDYAQKQASALEPRLPKLAIIPPARQPAGFIVKRDGERIDAAELGIALYVDPGIHEITATAPGFGAVTLTITLVESKTETLSIPSLTDAPAPGPATKSSEHPVERPAEPSNPAVAQSRTIDAAAAAEAPAPPSRTRRYVALGLGVGGAAAVGVGFLFGARANSSFGDAKTLCGADLVCNAANYDRGKQLIQDARSSAMTSTVLVAVGGAAIIAGAVVFLTAPRASERAAMLVVPAAGDGSVGLSMFGRF